MILTLRGGVTLKVWDARRYPTYTSTKTFDAKPLTTYRVQNLVVTAGKNEIADWIRGSGYASGMNYVGVGSSNQAPTVADTDLIAPIGARKQATDRFRTNNIATISTFFGSADNNGTWNECGLFENPTGGPMLARALFTPSITKDASRTITIDWDITVS